MKNKTLSLALALVGFTSTAFAETYQATGPVLEVTETKIVIEKAKGKWEFARTPETKVTGELKVGSTVTVHYSMTAVSTEEKKADKEEKAAEKATPKTEKKTEKADKAKTPETPVTPKKKAS